MICETCKRKKLLLFTSAVCEWCERKDALYADTGFVVFREDELAHEVNINKYVFANRQSAENWALICRIDLADAHIYQVGFHEPMPWYEGTGNTQGCRLGSTLITVWTAPRTHLPKYEAVRLRKVS